MKYLGERIGGGSSEVLRYVWDEWAGVETVVLMSRKDK